MIATPSRALEPQKAVAMFLEGSSCAEVAAFYGAKRSTVETILRQAIVGLAKLNDTYHSKEIATV